MFTLVIYLYILLMKLDFFIEFDDGSDWTLSKGLTHANRTSFSCYTVWCGKALNHNLGVARKMKWCKGEYIIFFGYLKVRKKIPYKEYDTASSQSDALSWLYKRKKLFALRCSRYFRVSSS